MAFAISGYSNNFYNQGMQGMQPPPPPPPGLNGQAPPPPPPPPTRSYASNGLDCTSFSGDALSSLGSGNINNQLQSILMNLMQGGNSAF